MATEVTDLPNLSGRSDGGEVFAVKDSDGAAAQYSLVNLGVERFGTVVATDYLDGVRTDSEAIQAAIEDVKARTQREDGDPTTGGGTVLIPPHPTHAEGRWEISDKTVVIHGTGITVKGFGSGATVVDGVNVPAFKFGQDNNPAHGGSGDLSTSSAVLCHLTDMLVRGLVGLDTGDPVVMMQGGRNCTVERCSITTYGSVYAGCIGHIQYPTNRTGIYDVAIRDCFLATHTTSTEQTSACIYTYNGQQRLNEWTIERCRVHGYPGKTEVPIINILNPEGSAYQTGWQIRDLTVEQPFGGFVYAEGFIGFVIDACSIWDMLNEFPTKHLIEFGTGASGMVPLNATISSVRLASGRGYLQANPARFIYAGTCHYLTILGCSGFSGGQGDVTMDLVNKRAIVLMSYINIIENGQNATVIGNNNDEPIWDVEYPTHT